MLIHTHTHTHTHIYIHTHIYKIHKYIFTSMMEYLCMCMLSHSDMSHSL